MKAGNAELNSEDSTLNLTRFDSLTLNNFQILKKNNTRYDSSVVEIRSIDSTRIKSYLKDKDFTYFKDPEFTKTLWERLKEWIMKQIYSLFELDSKGVAWTTFQYLLIAFAILALIFAIYKTEIKGLFLDSKKSKSIQFSESVEDINTIDYEKMIEEALENKNYRFAIRLNYLRTLKLLSDKGLINWKVDKTNHDYLSEINNSVLKSQFQNLTNNFETIWYGGLQINQTNYSELLVNYSDIRTLLETNQK